LSPQLGCCSACRLCLVLLWLCLASPAACQAAWNDDYGNDYGDDYEDDSSGALTEPNIATAYAFTGYAILFWIFAIGAIPLWVCSIAYGSIGISVARTWPNPSCCCFTSPYTDGDTAQCCCNLMTSNIVLLVFQSVMWLVHIISLAIEASYWTVVTPGTIIAQVNILVFRVSDHMTDSMTHIRPVYRCTAPPPPILCHTCTQRLHVNAVTCQQL